LGKYKKATPAVLREGLLALRDGDPKDVKSAIYQLMKRYDGKDRFYLCAVGIAVGHHDKGRRAALLADFAREFPGWGDQVAGLVWELRPPRAVTFLQRHLGDVKLSAAQRARIVDLLADAEDKDAGAVVLKLLASDAPGPVRERALEGLKRNLPGKWQHLKKGAAFDKAVQALLAKAEWRAEGLALVGAAGKTDAV